MAVLMTPPNIQYFDANGNPLNGGFIYTYQAGTNTPKATFSNESGLTQLTNPIELDSAGFPTTNGVTRTSVWLEGSYKFIVKDADGNTITTTDNVTSFTTLAAASNALFDSFSGNGSQTAFTLSQDLGTDEKAIMVYVDNGLQQSIANGNFATDTVWTKGAGWTIGAGVATAAGAISTAISQAATVTLIPGKAYAVTFTITRSAGGLIPSIGGQAGTERTASGTYREVIVCGSTQTVAFTGNGFTGTLDDVTITVADPPGYEVQNPNAYTLNGTTLTMAVAPASGTNNLYVFAPSTLVGAASAAAAAAAVSEANAAASAVLASAEAVIAQTSAGFGYNYLTDTASSDPGSGNLKFNNATLASATALYISETTLNSQGIAASISTWDDSTSTIHGTLRLFKQSDPAVFAFFNVTGTNVDNGGWDTVTVAYVDGAGSLSNNDDVTIQYVRNGDKGDTGATGPAGGPLADGNYGDVSVSSSGTVISYNADSVAQADLATAVRKLLADVQDFRLTLTTGVPVTTSDVTAATTIYCCPYIGNSIALFDGTNWNIRSSAQFSLALGTLTISRPHDVFCYDNAGTPTLEFLVWSGLTTRATALAYQDGVLIKSGDATRRYLGTFYTTTTTTTEDSTTKRHLWNYYHRVDRNLFITDAATSWNYTTAAYRLANNNAANVIEITVGVAEDMLKVDVQALASNASAIQVSSGIGIDSVTVTSATTKGGATPSTGYSSVPCSYVGIPSVGRHYYAWLEYSAAAGTTTWYGTTNEIRSGMTAQWRA